MGRNAGVNSACWHCFIELAFFYESIRSLRCGIGEDNDTSGLASMLHHNRVKL